MATPDAIAPLLGGDPRTDDPLAQQLARAALRRRLFAEHAPTLLARYVLQSRLGSGGMGIVYRAHDPELDRPVALKVIRGAGDAAAQAGLLREARALAALSHDNVLPVFDVGTVAREGGAGDTFIVTELVEGRSLHAWLTAAPRTVVEIRDVFAAAGRGLAAAHAAGLVHRDFKLGNVMVGDDGRVRVCDFGLVLAGPELGLAQDTRSDSHVAVGATRERAFWGSSGERPRAAMTDRIMGTPGYVAPEVLMGGTADSRSDQFAFCVALHVALYGRHPGEVGGDATGTAVAHVPESLRRVTLRGLDPDPGARYRSMTVLVEALAPQRALRWKTPAVAAVLAVMATIAFVSASEDRDPCQSEVALQGAWDPERREAIAKVLHEADAHRVVAHLEDYAAAWSAGYEGACRALAPEDTGLTTDDARLHCYHARRVELRALAVALSHEDAAASTSATRAATSLPALAACEAIGDTPTWRPPAHAAAAVEQAELRLAEARAQVALSQLPQAEALAQAAEALTEDLRGTPPWLDARIELGRIRRDLGQHEHAAAMLEEAYFEAIAAGERAWALRAATRRLEVAAHAEAREDGLAWARHAQTYLGEPQVATEAQMQFERALALMELRTGDPKVATPHMERALSLAIELYGPAHLQVVDCRHGVAQARREMGRFHEAVAFGTETVALVEAILGPDHVELADARGALAVSLLEVGRVDEGLAELRKVLAIQEATLPPDSLELATTLYNLGGALSEARQREEASALWKRTLEIRRGKLGDDHPRTISVQRSLATGLAESGRLAEARALLESAVAATQRRVGPDEPGNALLHYDLGRVLESLGQTALAMDAMAESVRVLEVTRGPAHFNLARPLRYLARGHSDPEIALQHARRLVRIVDGPDVDDKLRAEGHATLALALHRGAATAQEVDAELLRAATVCGSDEGCTAIVDAVAAEIAR